MRAPLAICLFIACSTGTAPVRAAEGHDACTAFIDALPATIGESGVHCLTSNLVHPTDAQRAILVDAPDVTIDCNDHIVDGSALSAESGAIGIDATTQAVNVTVRRCDLRGFAWAVSLSYGGIIEDNVFRRSRIQGIQIHGSPAIVRRNRILQTGDNPSFPAAIGIVASGRVELVDNEIVGVTAAPGTDGYAMGIIVGDSGESGTAVVARNSIRDLNPDGVQGITGITIYSTGAVIVRDNVLWGDGPFNSTGMSCSGTSTIVARNVIFDFLNPYGSCTPDSGNTVRD